MAIGVKVGKETTHGTIAGAFVSAAAGFTGNIKQNNKVLEEGRNGQDINFSATTGIRWVEWAVADSYVYHDTIGYFLASALGNPTSTVVETTAFSNVYKFVDDPRSLSMQWTQPRRITQSFQALNCVVDKMTFSFDIQGDLTWTATGVGSTLTDIAAPTFTFTTVKPLQAWTGTVTLSGSAAGAFADLIKGTITITRNRKPFHTIRNNRDAKSMTIGSRMVEYDLTVDFDSIDEYDDWRNGVEDALLIKFEDQAQTVGAVTKPSISFDVGRMFHEEANIDPETDLPSLNIKGKALYDGTDASLMVVTLVATNMST